jgi:hypothetical protein
LSVDRLCFGTSTFVAGRLRPDKNSESGMAALRHAVLAGLRLVHSNPRLGTQWAIRRVLDSMPDVAIRHLVKAEAPLDADPATVRACMRRAIDDSCAMLGVRRLHAITVEIDLKRTKNRAALADSLAVGGFFGLAATEALRSGRVDRVIAYCHSPAHLAAAVQAVGVGGVAAQYNVAEPWPALFLDHLEHRGLPFVGVSPLGRGRLAGLSMRDLRGGGWVAAGPSVGCCRSSGGHGRDHHVVAGACRAGHRRHGGAVASEFGSRAGRGVVGRRVTRSITRRKWLVTHG